MVTPLLVVLPVPKAGWAVAKMEVMDEIGLDTKERLPRKGRKVGRQALIRARVGSTEVQIRKGKLSR